MPVRVPPLNVATPLELVVASPNAVPLIEKLTVLLFRFEPLAVSFAVSVAGPLTAPLPETSEIVRSLSIMLRLRFGLGLLGKAKSLITEFPDTMGADCVAA